MIAGENTFDVGSHAPRQPVDDIEFRSLEELQAANEANGWSVEYRQLQPGAVRATISEAECAGITLISETVDRIAEVEGTVPADHVTVALPAGPTTTLNGARLDHQTIGLVEPGGEVYFWTNEQSAVVSMHVPATMLQGIAFGGSEHSEKWPLMKPSGVAVDAADAQRLRALMLSTIREDLPADWQTERAFEIVGQLDKMISVGRDSVERMTGRHAWQVAARAREYIEEHLSEPIAIDELCAHCAASRRNIERAFKSQLQVTPTGYIRARRLAHIMREIKHARSTGKSITQIATDYGFFHSGRFPSIYRSHFGELPSETLRSTP